jgi:hypothetical protein
MNNPEKQAGAIKNEQSRETGRSNQERTIQRNRQEQSRMNNPEKQTGAIKNEQSRETDRSNQE